MHRLKKEESREYTYWLATERQADSSVGNNEDEDRTVDEIRADSANGGASWAHRREYRSTYRANLTDSETVLEGEFIGEIEEGTSLIPISLEEDVANELGTPNKKKKT